MDQQPTKRSNQLRLRRISILVIPIFIILGIFAYQYANDQILTARAAPGVLSVEVLSGDNLVVDSNAKSPSTYAPSVASVAGKFCNTGAPGDDDLTDVQGYIGDYTAGTPGIHPVRGSGFGLPVDPAFDTQHPHLAGTGSYSFTQLGGVGEASRYIGTLAPGECSVQYWSFTYPQCENVAGSPESPPCTNDPVWGGSVKPDDDLYLYYDVWGTSAEGSNDNTTKKMTMRNEISAMANKIKPNPDGRWFVTDKIVVRAGEVITSNGVLYTFGNVNKGFDNDSDGFWDYNAWMQPYGDPSYDPSCFRLVRTTGTLTVSRSSNPPMILPFVDKLYFTYPDIPTDNNGVVGEVHYTFLALNGVCITPLSPYQEAASGKDNEKFNGDFGTGVPDIKSTTPEVTIDKSSSPNAVALGGTINYSLAFQNEATDGSFGLTLGSGYGVQMPLVISDTIPTGTTFVGGSAGYSLTYSPNNGIDILFSTDNGATWSSTEPAASSVTDIQWWLNDPLPAGKGGIGSFQVTAPGSAPSVPFIENRGCASLGSSARFACDDDTVMIQGSNSIGDWVWNDENSNGLQDTGETGIQNITLSLYWDANGDGALDSGDKLLYTTSSDSSGDYSFDNLPNSDYLVQVDTNDPDLDLLPGYSNTTAEVQAVTGLGTTITSPYNDADFGFGPVLELNKRLATSNPAYESELVTFTIDLTNNRPGDGTAQGYCRYTTRANHINYSPDVPSSGTGNAAWINETNALYREDGIFAESNISNNKNTLGLGDFLLGQQPGQITKVEMVLYVREIRDLSSGDNLQVTVYMTDTPRTPAYTYAGTYFTKTVGSDYTIIEDITSKNPSVWNWSMFASDIVEASLVADKGSGNQHGDFGLDAVAFRITTDKQDCSTNDDIIATLPMTDTYDADLLEFVSADPTQTFTSTSGSPPNTDGTITWSNLGPLYPGQTKSVDVTFKALDPSIAITTTNYANVTGAKFASGKSVNDANDSADVHIIPTGSLAGKIWSEVSPGTTGWVNPNGYEAGDADVPNVTVNIYGCYDVDTGELVTVPAPSINKSCEDQGNNGKWLLVDTQVTDADGDYLFEGLREGFYYVQVVDTTIPGSTHPQSAEPVPNGTGITCGTCNHRWGDPTANLTISNFDPVVGNEDITNINFGYQVPATIYGSVWNDNNGDGDQDSGENGFDGIRVYLDDCGGDGVCGSGGDDGPTVSTTTNSNGGYTFSDLTDNGNYRVRVDTSTLPSGGTWTQTADPDSVCPGVGCDDQTNVINVTGGVIHGAYDFAYTQSGTAAIGDTLYKDWNGDGSQDLTSEEGIPNVTIKLYEDSNGDGVIDPATDALMITTTTNSSGNYSFSNLPDGTYTVLVDTTDPDLPSNWPQTEDPDSTADDQGSQIVISSGSVTSIGGTGCSSCDNDIDFGYQPKGYASIGDFVWNDTNGNGVHDPGESGLAGVTVRLYENNNGGGLDSGDALIITATTDSSGNYLFSELPAGDYLVDVDTSITVGSDTYVVTTADPHAVTLGASQEYEDADFGYTPGGVIGDLIWQDNNADGTYDAASEPGINGVTVNLYNCGPNGTCEGGGGDDVLVGTKVTANDPTTGNPGWYEFTDLPEDDYVVVVTPPAGYTQTGDPDASSVPCSGGECNNQSEVSLSAGQTDRTSDFGYSPPSSIGDTLWIDVNGSGAVPDPDDRPVAYVTVWLYDCGPDTVCGNGDDVLQATTETDSNGLYSFGGNYNGNYNVRVDATDPDYTGLNIVQFYDPDGLLDNIGVFNIALGTSVTTIDFGYTYNGANTINGTVFLDKNVNGTHEPNGIDTIPGNADDETTFPNVAVTLLNCGPDNNCATTGDNYYMGSTVTDSSGNYSFPNLPDGTYRVIVDNNDPTLNGLTATNSNPRDIPVDPGSTDPNPQVHVADFGFFANMDCGDMPSSYSYRTNLYEEGPCHIREAGDTNLHYLGSLWDSEGDGQPGTPNATGDDLDTTDDEDGIIFYGDPATGFDDWANLAQSGGGTRWINAVANGDNAYLAGWFDWNNDGDFSNPLNDGYDVYEFVYFGKVEPGENVLPVTVPDCSALSNCFADDSVLFVRFRLYEGQSPPPVVAPTGNVTDGEVEDYRRPEAPTAVTLGGFDATPGISYVKLNWVAFMELEDDVAGFNLYRSVVMGGAPATMPNGSINGELIPAHDLGNPAGAFYEYVDGDAQSGKRYTYWLEVVRNDGTRQVISQVYATSLYGVFAPIAAR